MSGVAERRLASVAEQGGVPDVPDEGGLAGEGGAANANEQVLGDDVVIVDDAHGGGDADDVMHIKDGGVVAGGLVAFSARWLGRPLRPYQAAVAEAIQRSVLGDLGQSLTVMMARQMGKNELSAHLETWLLVRHALRGGTIVKAAPTFRPQIAHSMLRLEACLRRPELAPLLEALGAHGKWKRQGGNAIVLGEARAVFYSAEPGANVVGATASLLLEIDEAQHVDAEKYGRDFRPMASSTNATTVLYGTAWREDGLLEEQKRRNLEAAPRDGRRRHFEFDWSVGAAANLQYATFVQREVERLGRDHPLIRTQYYLEPLGAGGGFFSEEQCLLLRGTHPRERAPLAHAGPAGGAGGAAGAAGAAKRGARGGYYVAGVDVAGAAESPIAPGGRAAQDAALREVQPRKDSTVIGIGRVTPAADGALPRVEIVDLYWWTGRPLHEQCDQLIHLLRDVWRCARVAVDASGLGADLAARVQRACAPGVVEQVVFSAQTKSRLAYHLVSHVSAGRLQMWGEEGEEESRSPEAAEIWKEVALARPVMGSGGLLGFHVPPHQGHDDFVTMLALLSWAAREVRPALAHAALPPRPRWEDMGRYA